MAPVRVEGARASHPGPARDFDYGATSLLVDGDAALATVADGIGTPPFPARAAEMVLESCTQLFRGRKSSILDELAETWWLGEHGEPREGGGTRARRPYATLPIADRVELRERIATLLDSRMAESMGDVAVLEAETSSLLSIPSRALGRAGADIYRRAETDKRWRGTGASAACVLFAAGKASIAHVGSARVSRLRDGTLEPLTEEHSLRNQHRREHPDASEATLAEYPDNVLFRVLGLADNVETSQRVVPVEPGDVFVLTNRGAREVFSPLEIAMTLRARGLGTADYLAERAGRNPPNVQALNVGIVVAKVL